MGFFQWMYGTNSPAKDYKEAPAKGIGLYFYIVGTYFWKMVTLNLLFLVFCLPVVTIPAAAAASMRVYIKLVKDGYCLIFDEYWREFKQQFFGRLLVFFFLFVTPLSLAAYAYLIGFATAAAGLLLSFTIVSFLMQSYFFIIVALIDLPVRVNLKNSYILMFLEWKSSLLLLATVGVWYALCAMLLYFSLPIIFLFAFSAGQLGTCMCLLPGIERRLVSDAGGECDYSNAGSSSSANNAAGSIKTDSNK